MCAKAAFGMMMTDARGKLGGHVFSQNRSGNYIRTKVTPSNPRTVAQQTARFYLANFSKAWATLTVAEITAWNASVSNWARNNVFGNLKNPTGKNLYVKLNTLLANIGAAAISSPPIPASLSEIKTLAIATCTASTQTISWSSGAVPAAENWLLEATKCVSPGKNNVSNQYRVIANIAPAATSPYNSFAAYNAKFGAPVVGQRVNIRVKQIDNTTGTPGVPLTATFIVT
jgi:hypothetical protein